MSIVLGIPCVDGVVLGVDLQYTKEPFKNTGPKLFPLKKYYNKNTYSVLVAGSGNPESCKKFADMMEQDLPDDFSFSDFIIHAESIIGEFNQHYIFPMPQESRKDYSCDLLIAVRVDRECRLYGVNGLMLVRHEQPVCTGEGSYLADYLLENLLPKGFITVEAAAQFMVHAINSSKNYITSVGKGTSVHILRDDGRHYSLLKPDRAGIELYFQELFDAFARLMYCCDVESASNESVEIHIGSLRRIMALIRQNHAELIANRIKLKELTGLQCSTADPSGPQPSPESPGESDEF